MSSVNDYRGEFGAQTEPIRVRLVKSDLLEGSVWVSLSCVAFRGFVMVLPAVSRAIFPVSVRSNGLLCRHSEEESPQWLKELKSKKRLSQYDGES